MADSDDVKTVQGTKYFHIFKRKIRNEANVETTFPFGETTVPGPVPGTKDVVAIDVLLSGFDIDWYRLEDRHLYWLNIKALPFIMSDYKKRLGQGGSLVISIDAWASRTFKGPEDQSAEHNEILSHLREKEVIDFFKSRLNSTYITFNTNFHGFNNPPLPGTGEYRKHRSVRVVIQRPGLPPPKPVTVTEEPGICVVMEADYFVKSLQGPAVSLPLKGTPVSVGAAYRAMTLQETTCGTLYNYAVTVASFSIGGKTQLETLDRILSLLRGIIQGAKIESILKSSSLRSTLFIKNPLRLDLTVVPSTFVGGITLITATKDFVLPGMGLTGGAIIFSEVPIYNPFTWNPLQIRGCFLIGNAEVAIGPSAAQATGWCSLLSAPIKFLPGKLTAAK